MVGGAGFSVLPRYLCTEELASGAVALLHDPDDAPLIALFANCPTTEGV